MSSQVIAILSADNAMRNALTHCLDECGYDSYLPSANANPARAETGADTTLRQCQMAIVDLNDYPHGQVPQPQNLSAISDLPTVYLDRPLPKGQREMAFWNRQVAGKVACIHAESEYGPCNRADPVWLLLASAGGPEAVGEFIDALPMHCPVGFLYGQHISPGFETNLVTMLDGRRGFHASIAHTGQRLTPGQIAIVPADQSMFVLDGDVVLLDKQPWHGQFQPSLDALAAEYSRRNKNISGMIVFSGMGEDGRSAMRLYASSGGRVWAQAPHSCVVSSMPEAVLADQCVEFCAPPQQLAQRLASVYANE